MNQSLWIGKTGLTAQDTQLATIANNLSNAATVGYKRDRVIFEDLLYQIHRQPGAQSSQNTQLPSGMQLGTGVRVIGTQKEFTEGSVQVTEGALDIAIVGRGFFEVLTPEGDSAYTRNGQFQINSDGEMVTSRGMVLQPGITIPDDAQSITISTDGIVEATLQAQAAPVNLGQIQTVDFVNPAGLKSLGSNLFVETNASGTPISGTPASNGLGRLEQGTLENSNVDVVEELVNMITTQRTYEMNSKVLSTADQMLQFITQQL